MGFRTKWVRTATMVLFLIVLGPYTGLDGLIRMVGSGASTCNEWVEFVCRARLIRIPADGVEIYTRPCFCSRAVCRACLSIPPISRCHEL